MVEETLVVLGLTDIYKEKTPHGSAPGSVIPNDRHYEVSPHLINHQNSLKTKMFTLFLCFKTSKYSYESYRYKDTWFGIYVHPSVPPSVCLSGLAIFVGTDV